MVCDACEQCLRRHIFPDDLDITPIKLPIIHTNKSIKYFGLLFNTAPTLPVYKYNLQCIIENKPNPNINAPAIKLVFLRDKKAVAEFDRIARINANVLRHMTIRR